MTSEEIQAMFFVECEESLAAAEAGLAACRAGTQDADTVNAVHRAVHSIKGATGAFGFEALQAYTHTFETLLSDVRDGTVPICEPLIELLLRALDTLSDHVTVVREGGNSPDDAALIAAMTAALAENGGSAAAETPAPAPAAAAVVADAPASTEDESNPFDLDALLDSIAGESAPAEAPGWQVHLRPHAGAMVNGGEPLLLLRELAELGGHCVACDVSAVPPLDEIDPRQGYLGWTFAIPADRPEGAVRDVFDFVGDDCGIAIGGETIPPLQIAPAKPAAAAPPPVPEVVAAATGPAPALAAVPAEPAAPKAANVPAATAPAAPPAAGQSIRIDLIKLDRLIDTVGELVIAQAMLAQRLGGSGMAATEELALL